MKIFLIGPGGTGKTTLVNYLANHLNLPVIEEQIRKTAEEMNVIIRDIMPREVRVELQRKAYASQVNLENSLSSFVSDRSRLDYIVYSYLLGLSPEIECSLDYPSIANHMDGIVNKNDYCLFVFVGDFKDEIEDDGVRFIDEDFNMLEREKFYQLYLYVSRYVMFHGSEKNVAINMMRKDLNGRIDLLNRVVAMIKEGKAL
jgi:hypothetical protein